MTKITLSTGDKYTIETPSSKIMEAVNKEIWLMIEDNGRDIAIRCDHIIAVEEDTAAIIKESEQATEPHIKKRYTFINGTRYEG